MNALRGAVRCHNGELFGAKLSGRRAANFGSQRLASTMAAWKVSDSLNNSDDISIRHKLKCMDIRVPTISSPSDILVKVHSTSINPLDVRMCYGYGRRVLDLLDILTNHEVRITNDRYPLTLGRDFSGEVVACGPCCDKNLKPGDQVFGAIEPQRSGAHAEYVIASSNCVTKKPKNLSHNGAASIPFVALTAYSALCSFGGLSRNNCNGKSVLILGGSGGVGSFAIQLLKVWGANVTATCSEDKMEWLENTLFVDQALCYTDTAQMDSLKGRFDFVLDCGNYENTTRKRDEVVKDGLLFLRPLGQSVYVTLSPPILGNTDSHGLVLGGVQTALDVIKDTVASVKSLNSARWAVFLPNKEALTYVSSLLEDEAIQPQVHSVFSFNEMPDAYEELQGGFANGKVVVDVTSRNSASSGHDTTKHQRQQQKQHKANQSTSDNSSSNSL